MNYDQTINYLFTRLPMFSKVGADAIKHDVNNTLTLCRALNNPQQSFKSIHIAGTNGKGSTSHMLAAILQKAGYKTGLYTSPHLKDFRERIKINGSMIPKETIMDFTQKIQPLIEELEPSFFEITVAMAFDYFAKEAVDIAIIEVGLGGRLDSTNVITPEVSVITNIGWDHMNILGDTLEKIAYEKAGIIKPSIPVVIGESLPETRRVFTSVAEEKKAPIVFAEEKRRVIDWQYKQHFVQMEVVKLHSDEVQFYELDLPAVYQSKNIITVLETIHQLQQRGWEIDATHIQQALREVKKLTGLHGRWELIHEHPSVILDVAHNEDGINAVIRQLELTDFHHLHIVIGMVKDKEINKVLPLLPTHATYYFTNAQIPRALPAASLQEKAAAFSLKGEAYDEVNKAVKAAMDKAHKDDLILVCGSVFTVGEVAI